MSPTKTTLGIIRGFVISLFPNLYFVSCGYVAQHTYVARHEDIAKIFACVIFGTLSVLSSPSPLSVAHHGAEYGRRRNAGSRIGDGGYTRANRSVRGTRSPAWAQRNAACSSVGHRPSVGWLWSGLASGTRPLEPVARRMGSPA